jgi:hypothetical protein
VTVVVDIETGEPDTQQLQLLLCSAIDGRLLLIASSIRDPKKKTQLGPPLRRLAVREPYNMDCTAPVDTNAGFPRTPQN